MGTGVCQRCGTGDVLADVEFSIHSGYLIWWRDQTLSGWLYRRCTGELFREYLAHCLLFGWWGIFSLILMNPLTLAGNAITHLRAKRYFRKVADEAKERA